MIHTTKENGILKRDNKDKIRVLIVEDSSVIRTLVRRLLEKDPEIEVVGTAFNGQIALEKIPILAPNVILLDIEMPVMNGIDFLKEFRKTYSQPTIVLSGINNPKTTLECLRLGAQDFMIKPSSSLSLDIQTIQEELISKIKFFHKTRSHLRERELASPLQKKIFSMKGLEVLLFGISTGGPYALKKLLVEFEENYPVPIVVAQHMPPNFISELVKLLDPICPLKVKEIQPDEKLERGKIYFAPSNVHVVLEKRNQSVHFVLKELLTEKKETLFYKPSIDLLFDSANQLFHNRIIAVICTGMGKDGTKALKKIHHDGGITIAQDQESCVIFGMPKVAIEMGCVDEVLSLEEIPKRILTITQKILRSS